MIKARRALTSSGWTRCGREAQVTATEPRPAPEIHDGAIIRRPSGIGTDNLPDQREIKGDGEGGLGGLVDASAHIEAARSFNAQPSGRRCRSAESILPPEASMPVIPIG